MRILLGRHFLLLALLLFALIAMPLRGFCLPTNGRVLDRANILTQNEIARIETQLADYDARTSVEILLITTRNLEGLDLNEFATQAGNRLKIGKRDLNNGIIILIVPSTMPPYQMPTTTSHYDKDPLDALLYALNSDQHGNSDSTIPTILKQIYIQGKSLSTQPEFKQRPAGFYGAGYIAPGYGIESALPDIVCRRIMMDAVRPYIMAHQNANACSMAIAMTIAELESQYSMGNQEWARENRAPNSTPSPKGILAIILTVGLPILLFALSFSKGPAGAIANAILFAVLSSGHSNGSRGFGSNSGGSFSGGGGSFGGGGGGGNF